MAQVIPGRFTAQTDDAFVVFIIGLRVNTFFAVRRWIPAALEMRPLLRALVTLSLCSLYGPVLWELCGPIAGASPPRQLGPLPPFREVNGARYQGVEPSSAGVGGQADAGSLRRRAILSCEMVKARGH